MGEWLEVSVAVDAETAEAVAEVLSRYIPQGVALDLGEGEGEAVTVKAYLEVDEQVDVHRRQIEEALWHLGQITPIPPPGFSLIPDQDWTAGWKESIQVLHLGQHIVIKPSWRTYTPSTSETVLEMDPGLAFGTGLHPTTQLCVAALEELMVPGACVLDMGTGTGILAMVAAKLGAKQVLAVDTDAHAITATQRNARDNGIEHLLNVIHGSLQDVQGDYDVILANILAPVIIQMVQSGLAQHLRHSGILIVSGILEEQVAAVQTVLLEAGLKVIQTRQQGDWVALITGWG
ncbi:MAG: 50S ribosomal protein L11 methyltransferase [Anaerolineae bacterium]|nr:50S ribosomal protein L11 methyltransferase [Anaerolineae bacterium]